MNFDSRLALVGIVASAIIASLTAGWTFGFYSRSDRIETLDKEVQSYRDAKNLNMPETIRILVNTNTSIEKNISEINAHYNWKSEEENLKSKISDLSSEVKDKTDLLENEIKKSAELKTKLVKTQKELELLSPVNEEFWLEMRETKHFSGFEKTLGIPFISATSVMTNFDNSSRSLSIGEHIEFTIKNSNCKLILSKIDIYSIRALFNNVCTKI
jgi:gas vesicle protein